MTRTAVLLLATVAVTAAGCGANRGDRVRETEKTVQREQTPEKLLERGKLFARVGDYTRASQYLNSALDAGAPPSEVLPVLMKVYIVSGRFRLAIQLGEQQLTKTPEAHSLRFLVGTLYAAIGDNDRARENLERVVRAQPGHAEAHYALAVLLRDGTHDLVGADEHFRAYLKLEPTGPHAEEARGSLLQEVP
jgi:tetratricopeptide (TPR) repeat protein